MTIGFILPGLIAGSGGHRTILRHAAAAAERTDVELWVIETDAEPSEVWAAIDALAPVPGARLRFGDPREADVDILVATAWFTAETVLHNEHCSQRGYFVQDYEAMFNPVGAPYLRAVQSYDYPLRKVTIGRWLAHRLAVEHGSVSASTVFGVDLESYSPGPSPISPAVCAILQPEKPRRLTELLIEALGKVVERRPDCTVYLYGTLHAIEIPFPHVWLGLLAEQDLAELYRQCSVGLVASATNPSRVPFEMMAAGLPVVDIFGESTLFDLPGPAVTLAYPGAASISEAILMLLDDRRRRAACRSAAIEAVAGHTTLLESTQFVDFMLDDESFDAASGDPPEPIRSRSECVVADEDLDIAEGYLRRNAAQALDSHSALAAGIAFSERTASG